MGRVDESRREGEGEEAEEAVSRSGLKHTHDRRLRVAALVADLFDGRARAESGNAPMLLRAEGCVVCETEGATALVEGAAGMSKEELLGGLKREGERAGKRAR